MTMIGWQRLEGAVVFCAALVLFAYLDDGVAWWLAVILFFAPDISFAAYALGPRVGAVGYNIAHLYGFGAILIAIGLMAGAMTVSALGALWLAHAGIDRMLGYGLKSPEGFKITHLGPIGGAGQP
ncbi:DUF4260 domain-containing protein [Limimaricola sp.]|uniref:DUF4260 domain-containing protein n=1 Tax=Limimaricola sp. TaxID=2211665 RepID=UPI004059281D